MTPTYTPAPDRWNDELQDSLDDRVIWSKSCDLTTDMEELERNTLAFFNELKDIYNS